MLDESKYVKWSELGSPALPGTYRTQDRKVVQISIHLILAKDKIHGDPLVQIVPRQTAGENMWIGTGFVDHNPE